MKTQNPVRGLVAACVLLSAIGTSSAEDVSVAVASNFSDAMQAIVARFEADTAHRVTLIFGSTGKHYAQIKNGAPFDLFFAADLERPALLEKEGLASPGTRFTYALGKLVLWSPKEDYVDDRGKVLEQADFRYLAVANPKLAPYGKAAEEVLQAKSVREALRDRFVQGEDIEQTFQFVKSGNAELGFVAYSQIKRPDQPIPGSYWEIPRSLYAPINQQAVLLKEKVAARALLSFVKSETARSIIRAFGYATP